MRIDLLHLVRYGSFSDVSLSFAHHGPAFHLVYGPNEAGKSTALRAIHGLLYGIPERTGDRHRHGNDLWLRAVLRDAGGSTLEVQRRRGRRATLRDAENAPMPEVRLQRFLAGVDASLFSNLFGLDHESLRRGAEALLFDRGAVGEALFEVGLGGRSVSRVLQEVRAEADAIFLPRATKRQLNVALDGFREANRRAQVDALHADEYDARARAVSEAEGELKDLRSRRQALAEERGRLQRVAAVVVPLAERQRLLGALGELSDVRLLPLGAGAARMEAMATLARTGPEREQLLAQCDRLAARLEGLRVPEELVDLGDEVQALRDQLGSHRKAAQDLPRRRQELKSMQTEARAILRRLGWSTSLKDVEGRRLSRPQVVRIRELSRRAAALEAGVEQAREALERARAAEAAVGAAEPARDPSLQAVLRELLHTAQRLGDPVERRAELSAAHARRRAAWEAAVAGLVPALPTHADFGELPLPGEEAVRTLATETERVSEQDKRTGRELEVCRRRLNEAQQELSVLARGERLPSEAQLHTARDQRDAALSVVLSTSHAVAGEPSRGEGASAPRGTHEAVRTLVRAADDLSDRLRWEAARVSKAAHLEAEIAARQREEVELSRAQQGLTATRAALGERLRELFTPAGVSPLSASAMVEWLRIVSTLRVEALAVQQAEADLADYEGRLERLASRLSEHLGQGVAAPEGATVDVALAERLQRLAQEAAAHLEGESLAAEERRQRVERREQRRADRLAAEAEQQRREEALAAWRTAWGAMMGPLSLPEDATVAQAEAVLEAVDSLFDKVDRLEPLRSRIEGMERDSADFERAVRRMSDRYLYRLGDVELEEAAEELSRAHVRALRDREERQRLTRELVGLRTRLDEVTLQNQQAEAALDQLCRSAGVDDIERLEEAEDASERRRALSEELARNESQIRAAGQGLSFQALQVEAADWSPDRATARLQELELEAHALDRDLERASRELAQAEEARRRLLGKEGAASAASEAAASAEKVRDLVERYVRLRLAERFLGSEIERYRKRHQAPVLERAEGIFTSLTEGHYEGLAVDYARGDQPLLCALRDGQRVGVEGLSDGTRDQLYLALRLATLHEHAAQSEPVPLVLDDVLIHFDDERARAALAVLGQFASVTQVLFFTHHARLLELARTAIDADVLCEHRLQRASEQVSQGAPC